MVVAADIIYCVHKIHIHVQISDLDSEFGPAAHHHTLGCDSMVKMTKLEVERRTESVNEDTYHIR